MDRIASLDPRSSSARSVVTRAFICFVLVSKYGAAVLSQPSSIGGGEWKLGPIIGGEGLDVESSQHPQHSSPWKQQTSAQWQPETSRVGDLKVDGRRTFLEAGYSEQHLIHNAFSTSDEEKGIVDRPSLFGALRWLYGWKLAVSEEAADCPDCEAVKPISGCPLRRLVGTGRAPETDEGAEFESGDGGPELSAYQEQKSVASLRPLDALGIVLIALFCCVAIAVGTGGGGLFVPIMILTMNMDTHQATAMSQSLMVGGSLAGTLINCFQRHPIADRPLVDMDLVLLLGPLQIGGAMIGVLVNKCFPAYLILAVMLIVLSCMGYKTIRKYKETRAKEKLLRAQRSKSKVLPSDAVDAAPSSSAPAQHDVISSVATDGLPSGGCWSAREVVATGPNEGVSSSRANSVLCPVHSGQLVRPSSPSASASDEAGQPAEPQTGSSAEAQYRIAQEAKAVEEKSKDGEENKCAPSTVVRILLSFCSGKKMVEDPGGGVATAQRRSQRGRYFGSSRKSPSCIEVPGCSRNRDIGGSQPVAGDGGIMDVPVPSEPRVVTDEEGGGPSEKSNEILTVSPGTGRHVSHEGLGEAAEEPEQTELASPSLDDAFGKGTRLDLLVCTCGVAAKPYRSPTLIQKHERRYAYGKWALMVFIWAVNMTLLILRGSKTNAIGVVPFCQAGYWILYVFSVVFLMFWSIQAGCRMIHVTHEKVAVQFPFVEGDLEYRTNTLLILWGQTVLAGVVAGTIGIGGGMVLGPLMLQKGILPQVATAANATLVLVTSSSAAVSFIMGGQSPWDLSLLLGSVCFVFSFVGKLVLDRIVRKYNVGSLLVLLLFVVIIASLVAMTVSGILKIIAGGPAALRFRSPCD